MMNKNKRCAESGGFTLMELVIVIIAFGVIGTITVSILNSAANFYFDVLNRQTVINDNRAALSRMTREIALQKDFNNIEHATDKELQFVTPRNDTLYYNLNGGQINLTKNSSGPHKLSTKILSSKSFFAFEDKAGNPLGNFPLSTTDLTKVWLINVRITTSLGKDTLRLDSAIFPKNLHHGQIMPYNAL